MQQCSNTIYDNLNKYRHNRKPQRKLKSFPNAAPMFKHNIKLFSNAAPKQIKIFFLKEVLHENLTP